ncbi:MAG: hypothetical protein R2932_15000 [Caldilineaceae bacterium]
MRHAIKIYAAVWQRWLIGNAVGLPAGALAAVGGYALVAWQRLKIFCLVYCPAGR